MLQKQKSYVDLLFLFQINTLVEQFWLWLGKFIAYHCGIFPVAIWKASQSDFKNCAILRSWQAYTNNYFFQLTSIIIWMILGSWMSSYDIFTTTAHSHVFGSVQWYLFGDIRGVTVVTHCSVCCNADSKQIKIQSNLLRRASQKTDTSLYEGHFSYPLMKVIHSLLPL